MSTLAWSPLGAADLPDLQSLAQACLDADGGLPELASPEVLERLFLGGESIGGRDETGDLVAAASVHLDAEGRVATGLTHPQVRDQHLGADLVRWCIERSGSSHVRIVAETTSPGQDALFAELGLTRVLAEHVMRHRRRELPRIPLPEGLTKQALTAQTAPVFFAAYQASFADRPGFTNPPEDEWVDGLLADPDTIPAESRVVLDAAGDAVGFVTVSPGWIDQVGVVPSWRGRGVGAHLVVRSIAALRRVGGRAVWLCVNVDNPKAHELYLRLGFKDRGMRARYTAR